MARYVFTGKNDKGECVRYEESTRAEDREDEGTQCGAGYLGFWERCMKLASDTKEIVHGEFEDLFYGEVVKEF